VQLKRIEIVIAVYGRLDLATYQQRTGLANQFLREGKRKRKTALVSFQIMVEQINQHWGA
jgi:hypothetical protein